MPNKEEKIAIITEYYNSSNYGGNLQAYALTRYLNENKVFAEQLPYKRPYKSFWHELHEVEGWGKKIELLIKKTVQKTLKRKDFKRIRKRRELVMEFGRQQIPHNETAFSDDELQTAKTDPNSEIAKKLQQYSAFVTGSDQVWRTTKKEAYFLTFVSEGKKKISYAASIAKTSLQEDEKDFFRTSLKDFDAISVREKSDAVLLDSICEQEIEWVVDPTLLLDETQWSNICSPRLRKEKYAFCYLLGGEKNARKIAKEYAHKHGLKLLTMPYLTQEYPFEDFSKSGKNEERLFEVGVEEFLSLIRYANAIFTDSFHAVVFSGIFKKQYFVFDRPLGVSMNSRIKSLLEIYETLERFCVTAEKENLKYIEELPPIDYERHLKGLEDMKMKSMMWLNKNIGGIG